MNRINRVIVVVGVLVLILAPTSKGPLLASDAGEQAQIRTLLQSQTEAWNRGDIDGFMAGYWKSEETVFVSASGITRGWQSVLERYKKSYPDRKAMGQLTFSALEIHLVCADAAFAIGQFQLERETDKPAGIFTLNFRKFPAGWKIVADHTTAFASPDASMTH